MWNICVVDIVAKQYDNVSFHDGVIDIIPHFFTTVNNMMHGTTTTTTY
jgi:hypothetical protein